jgi:hypothetical protein
MQGAATQHAHSWDTNVSHRVHPAPVPASTTFTADPNQNGSSVPYRGLHPLRAQDGRQFQTRTNNDAATMTSPSPHHPSSHPLQSLSSLSLPSTSTFHLPSTSHSSRVLPFSEPVLVSLPVHTGANARQGFIRHAKSGSVWFRLGYVTEGAYAEGTQENIFMKVQGALGTLQHLKAIPPQYDGDCFHIDCGSCTSMGHFIAFEKALPRLVCSDGTVLPLTLNKNGFFLEIRLNAKGQPF